MSRPRNPAGAINKISPGLLQGGVFEEKQHTTAIFERIDLRVQKSWSQGTKWHTNLCTNRKTISSIQRPLSILQLHENNF